MSNKNTTVAKSGKPAESANKSNDRNEYIPSFISKKPFYISDELQTDADYLDHQRSKSEKTSDTLAEAKWYDRGTTTGQRATKYRKGACENCGSMSHKAKDCLQRKRKQGAKWTGRDIAGDERVQEVKLGWDAKRDRWNGFTAEEYKEVVEDYEVMEEMKKAKIAAAKAEAGEDDEEADGEEGAKYEAETDMGRKQATSTRQLRLREDTAKYLLNLDLESAKYDPKTRSMLDTETSTNELIAEDGFQRASGDAAEFEKATRYAWETQEKGSGGTVHLQANPTEAQLTRKRKAEDEIQKAETKRKQLAEKYGAQDDIAKKPSALIAASNDRYVEYDAHGRPKGALEAAKKVEKSEEGREAAEHAEAFSKGLLLPGAEEQSEEVVEDETEQVSHVPNAPDRPEKQNMDESRRRAEELTTGVTEEDMEKYRREKVVGNDPMAGLLGKDELVG
ncbi:mRNA splicing protein [Elasticomyces elasticus]|nr:mRNA splicing protein [Elasticomyces elasticus]KAK4966228.1 mRNA splicing protein [Elasticomyces elasticus]